EVASGAKRAGLGAADPKHRRIYLTDGSRSPLYAVQMRRDAPVCLAFSPDGRYLALAQATPAIHLWAVRAAREVGRLAVHEGGVVSLLFTSDGRHLVSAGAGTTLLTWDVAHFLADLGRERFETRRQAQSELEALGESAEPALRKALAGDPPLDLRQRLERIVDGLSGQLPPPGRLRDLRAVEVMESIGTS